MYFHGGGWVLGDDATHDRLAREIALGAAAAVVFVNYSRSPEARHPVALEECYAATQWIAANGMSVAIDGSRLAVAGDSAGGNLAAAVALLAKERGGPKLALQALFYPVTDANFETASYQQFADGPWLTREAMRWFWDHYQPDAAARQAITAAPLRASLEQLRDLPPAFVATAEFDVLRDEGEAYAHKLSEAGVRVTAVRYLGAIHDVVLLTALAATPTARAAIDQACNALEHAFVPS
jgi:acetyl esterase